MAVEQKRQNVRSDKMQRKMSKNQLIMQLTVAMLYTFFIGFGLGMMFLAPEIGFLLLIGGVVYTVFSFKTVAADKVGTITCFGAPALAVESGLHFIPLGIAQLHTDTKNYIQIVFGTPMSDKNNVVRSVQNQVDGIVVVEEPLRVNFARWQEATYHGLAKESVEEEQKNDKGNNLGQALTSDPNLVARFRIEDHPTFLVTVGNLTNLIRQIIDVNEIALQEFCGSCTLAYVRRNVKLVSDHLTARSEWLVGEPSREAPIGREAYRKEWWGIDLESVWIKYLGIPRRVNEGMATASSAISAAEEVVSKSAGEQTRLINEGIGHAKAEEALLKARAVGYAALQKELKANGADAMQLETIKEALQKGNNQLISVNGLEGLLTSALSALAKKAT